MSKLLIHLLLWAASCSLMAFAIARSTGVSGAEISPLVKGSKLVVQIPKELRFEPSWRKQGDCGPLSLFVLMRLEEHPVSLDRVAKVLRFDSEFGCSLADMKRAADALDFPTEIRFVNPHDLPKVPSPFILHTAGSLERGTGHFLVIVDFSSEKHEYYVIDTAHGNFRPQTATSVLVDYSGYVLLPKRSFFGTLVSPRTSWVLLLLGCVLAVAVIFQISWRRNRYN